MVKKIEINDGIVYSSLTPCGACFTIDGKKDLTIMSVVLAVCGENFCTFMSDGRKVSLDHDCRPNGVISEDFPKVVRLGNNVIFGMSGRFHCSETLLSPFAECTDIESITLSEAVKCVSEFVDKNWNFLLCRTYFIGGKDENGEFCFYMLRFSDNCDACEPILYKPSCNTFQTKMVAPRGVNSQAILDEHLYSKMPWVDLDNLHMYMQDVIREVANVNDTVGGKIFVETVV